MNDELYDVVQVGYGPVGQTMSALLGGHGHSVAVFERWPDPYALSRAGHCDHEIMRILQSVGGAAEVEAKAWPMTGYEWFNAEGEVLLRLDWDHDGPSGWHSDYLFYQPDLEAVLDRIARTQPTVEVNRAWEAVSLAQLDDHVELTVRECGAGRAGETRTVRGRYVIGADGANSFVRRACGIGWEDLGFEAEWLVVDVRPYDPAMQIDMPDAGQICDPARPTSLFRWLGRRHCRWEFMLLPGEAQEEMEAPEISWELLARWGLTPDNADLVRNRVYRFRSLLAEEWRTSRAILVGDAAHLMPPFMGQGMCSGLRDAKNLAWKLDLVLRGKADPSLLDTYEPERKPHVRTVIEMSVELGKVICVSDPEAAAARDEAFFSGRVPPPPPFPGLVDGVLHRDADGTLVAPAGRLGIQGRVTYRGRTGLFDDVVDQGWAVISARSDPRSVLTDEQVTFLEEIGARVVRVTPDDAPGAATDIDGRYAGWFEETGLEAAIVRPDFYVFGGVESTGALPDLVDDLRARIAGGGEGTRPVGGPLAQEQHVNEAVVPGTVPGGS